MQIADFKIGGDKVFVIAEIGNNHNAVANLALEMVDAARDLFGVDCVKFQMRDMKAVYRKKSLAKHGEDLGTEYVLDLLERLSRLWMNTSMSRTIATTGNVVHMCTPWDPNSIHQLEESNVEAYKVASADLTNLPLIEHTSTRKPIILSTGMSSVEEIQATR